VLVARRVRLGVRGDRTRIHLGQPERLEPVAGVGPQAVADQLVELGVGGLRDDAAQVLAQLLGALAVAHRGHVGHRPERAPRERRRQRLDRAPPRGEAQIDGARPQVAHIH